MPRQPNDWGGSASLGSVRLTKIAVGAGMTLAVRSINWDCELHAVATEFALASDSSPIPSFGRKLQGGSCHWCSVCRAAYQFIELEGAPADAGGPIRSKRDQLRGALREAVSRYPFVRNCGPDLSL